MSGICIIVRRRKLEIQAGYCKPPLPSTIGDRTISLATSHPSYANIHAASPQWLLIATMPTSCINKASWIDYVYRDRTSWETGCSWWKRGPTVANSFIRRTRSFRSTRFLVNYRALLWLSIVLRLIKKKFRFLDGKFCFTCFSKFANRGNPNIAIPYWIQSCICICIW